jgi:RHS repeat-associated protein
MIRHINLGGCGEVWYQYDSGKQRTRKRIEHNGSGVEERIYLGGFERYRRWVAGRLIEEIESHHLFEGEQRVLLVDDVIRASGASNTQPDGLSVRAQTLFRYQYGNHLGSACLELDHQSEVISYEEYHPYGTSAYRLMESRVEVPAKRYRYTGMERDEESGLSYHVARYYACWLGRWTSCDPAPTSPTAYSYTSQPITKYDLDGKAPKDGYPISEPVPWGLPADVTIALAKKRAAEIKLDAAIRKSDAESKGQALDEAHRADLEVQGAEEFHDFHKNVGGKVALGAGGLAVSAPVVGTVGLVGAFVGGFGLSTLRQGAQVLDGSRTSISYSDSFEDAGWAGAFSAVSKIPYSQFAFAGLGVLSSAHEFSEGNKFTGAFDAATGVYALRNKLFNFKINASIEPGLDAPATQSVATLGLSLAVTSGKGSPSSPFNVLMIGQTSDLFSLWRTIAGRTLKGDAGSIHGEDQWRGGQTIITAKLQLPNGGKVLVAAPNSSAGWRPGQRDLAIRLGYSPIDPYNPGSEIHAEGNLQSAIGDRNSPYFGAKVLGWAISRGRTGSSIVCNEGCRTFTNLWGPQQK